MGILSWIIVGLIAGALANVIFPGREKGGWLAALALGIVGAIVGGFIFGVITGADMVTGVNLTSILVAMVGALILLFGYRMLTGGRAASAS
jgi:uncharacterized membrane protein YeaQ/YmgE (transglycosylase-associated protein family)